MDGECPYDPFDSLITFVRYGMLSWTFCLPVLQLIFVLHVVGEHPSPPTVHACWKFVARMATDIIVTNVYVVKWDLEEQIMWVGWFSFGIACRCAVLMISLRIGEAIGAADGRSLTRKHTWNPLYVIQLAVIFMVYLGTYALDYTGSLSWITATMLFFEFGVIQLHICCTSLLLVAATDDRESHRSEQAKRTMRRRENYGVNLNEYIARPLARVVLHRMDLPGGVAEIAVIKAFDAAVSESCRFAWKVFILLVRPPSLSPADSFILLGVIQDLTNCMHSIATFMRTYQMHRAMKKMPNASVEEIAAAETCAICWSKFGAEGTEDAPSPPPSPTSARAGEARAPTAQPAPEPAPEPAPLLDGDALAAAEPAVPRRTPPLDDLGDERWVMFNVPRAVDVLDVFVRYCFFTAPHGLGPMRPWCRWLFGPPPSELARARPAYVAKRLPCGHIFHRRCVMQVCCVASSVSPPSAPLAIFALAHRSSITHVLPHPSQYLRSLSCFDTPRNAHDVTQWVTTSDQVNANPSLQTGRCPMCQHPIFDSNGAIAAPSPGQAKLSATQMAERKALAETRGGTVLVPWPTAETARSKDEAFVEMNALGEKVMYYNSRLIAWPMFKLIVTKEHLAGRDRADEPGAAKQRVVEAMKRNLPPGWTPSIAKLSDPGGKQERLLYYRSGTSVQFLHPLASEAEKLHMRMSQARDAASRVRRIPRGRVGGGPPPRGVPPRGQPPRGVPPRGVPPRGPPPRGPPLLRPRGPRPRGPPPRGRGPAPRGRHPRDRPPRRPN